MDSKGCSKDELMVDGWFEFNRHSFRRRTTTNRLMRQQSTVNAGQQGLQGAYLDVPWFLQMEMFRSREMRRKLKETDV